MVAVFGYFVDYKSRLEKIITLNLEIVFKYQHLNREVNWPFKKNVKWEFSDLIYPQTLP